MNNNEFIMHVRKNYDRIKVGNSELDIICQYIKEYCDKKNNLVKKELITFLAQNNEALKLRNSQ